MMFGWFKQDMILISLRIRTRSALFSIALFLINFTATCKVNSSLFFSTSSAKTINSFHPSVSQSVAFSISISAFDLSPFKPSTHHNNKLTTTRVRALQMEGHDNSPGAIRINKKLRGLQMETQNDGRRPCKRADDAEWRDAQLRHKSASKWI